MRRVIRHPDHFHPFAVPIDILLISTTVTTRELRSKVLCGRQLKAVKAVKVNCRRPIRGCFGALAMLPFTLCAFVTMVEPFFFAKPCVTCHSLQRPGSIMVNPLIIIDHQRSQTSKISDTMIMCSMETESFESSISRRTEKNSACYCLLNGGKIMPFSSWITLLW